MLTRFTALGLLFNHNYVQDHERLTEAGATTGRWHVLDSRWSLCHLGGQLQEDLFSYANANVDTNLLKMFAFADRRSLLCDLDGFHRPVVCLTVC